MAHPSSAAQRSSPSGSRTATTNIPERRVDPHGHGLPAPHGIRKSKPKRKQKPWTQRIRVIDGDEEETVQNAVQKSAQRSNPQRSAASSTASIPKAPISKATAPKEHDRKATATKTDNRNNVKEAKMSATNSAANTVKHENELIPALIRNDKIRVKLWENATDEERIASQLLCEFKATTAKTGISSYFDFAEKWNNTFPNRKGSDRGLGTVKKAAKIAQITESTIYSILKTTKFYGRTGYDALAKKAAPNGVVIEWTQLRTISNRLADNKEARTEIERELVQRKLTEAQLNALIDEKAPETIRSRAGQKTKRSALASIDALNVTLAKMLREQGNITHALDTAEAEYNGDFDQSETIVKVCGKTIELLSDLTIAFGGYHDCLDRLVEAAKQIVNNTAKGKALSEKAKKVKQQIAEENARAAEAEKKRQSRVQLMGDFADEEETVKPKRAVRQPALDHLPDTDDGYDGAQEQPRQKVAAVLIDSEDEGEYNEDENDEGEYNEDEAEGEYNEDEAEGEYDEDDGSDFEDETFEDGDFEDDSEEEDSEEEDEGEDEDDGFDDDGYEGYDEEDEGYDVDDQEVADIFDENGNIP